MTEGGTVHAGHPGEHGKGDTLLSFCTMLPDFQVNSVMAVAQLPSWGKVWLL